MLIHSNKIQRAFTRAANTYEVHASIQNSVGLKLISTIVLKKYESALDLGCGVGLSTQQLLNSHQIDHLLAADISAASLELAQKQLNEPTISFSVLDFDTAFPNQIFDLIFANMSLQWSRDLSSLLNKIYQHLASGGVFTFSIPLDGTFIELTNQFSLNTFYTITAITAFLNMFDVKIMHSSTEFMTLHFPDTLSALRYIKQLGANHVTNRHKLGLLGKNALRHANIKTLTYHIGYFTIRKEI